MQRDNITLNRQQMALYLLSKIIIMSWIELTAEGAQSRLHLAHAQCHLDVWSRTMGGDLCCFLRKFNWRSTNGKRSPYRWFNSDMSGTSVIFTALITSCVLTQLVVALHALWVKVVCAYRYIQQHVPHGIHSHSHACKANIIHCSDIFYSLSIVVCLHEFINYY